MCTQAARRQLLQSDSATGLKPQKVPHNWFGSAITLPQVCTDGEGGVRRLLCHDRRRGFPSGGVTLSPCPLAEVRRLPQGPKSSGILT